MHDTPAPFPHWMLREIHEQPDALRATLDHYTDTHGFRPEAVAPVRAWLAGQRALLIAASGSSRHAGLFAEMALEALSPLAVDVEFASEYGLREVRARAEAGVLVISQSGETADTLAALRRAREAGLRTLALTNVPGSTMARESDLHVPVLAGRERAIPATKSFTGQLLVLHLLALLAGEAAGTLTGTELHAGLNGLRLLPDRIAAQLPTWETAMRAAAERFSAAESFLFLGRGVDYPIAREGALKLKESAYVHAEGYPAGELKHGPNALVSARVPLVVLATVDRDDALSVARHDKTLALLSDLRAQGASMLVLGNTGDAAAATPADVFVAVEPGRELETALAEVIPLQMLAYSAAIGGGINVDRPRNLVKAVVAE